MVSKPAARSAGSLSDLNIEYCELKIAFDTVLEENSHLRAELAVSKQSLTALRQNLTNSGGEGGVRQHQIMQMKFRMDALGINAVGSDDRKIDQRLLTAVGDLRVAAAERKALSGALVRLTEASAFYAKTTNGAEPESRLALETELRNAHATLERSTSSIAEQAGVTPTVSGGSVISMKEDLALVVMNLGSSHGVKVGMPFQIMRGAKVIGSVRIVDVREKVAGAVIQNLSSDKEHIKIGDHLRVDAQK